MSDYRGAEIGQLPEHQRPKGPRVVVEPCMWRWVVYDGDERVEVGPEAYSSEVAAQAAGARQIRAMNVNEGVEAHKDEEDLL